MPHVLIRTADGNFRFTQVDGATYQISSVDYSVPNWGQRVVGDEDSSPDPSFIGKKINDIASISVPSGVMNFKILNISRS